MSFPCISCQSPVEAHFKSCPACGDAISDFLREYANKPIGGNYQLTGRLGRGGMGEVYRARHRFLESDCVIKVMRPSATDDPQMGERFIREARVARKIQHRNVASLYEFSGLPDGSYYMVTEFIDGSNVGQIIRDHGALPAAYVISLSIQALQGLQAIHEAGFVHRDISPDNIMVTRDDKGADLVKIIDLGIAKQGEESGDAMTKTGMFIGKLKYASPEQLGILPDGQRIDGRADIYSFGLVMYEMLAGKAAFQASSPHEYLVMQTRQAPEPLKIDRAVAGSAELEALLLRAVAKDRNERFSSAAEFAAALARLPALAGGGRDVTAVAAAPLRSSTTAAAGDTTDPYSVLPAAIQAPPARKWLWAVPVVLLAAALTAYVLKSSNPPPRTPPVAPIARVAPPAPAAPRASVPGGAAVQQPSIIVRGDTVSPAATSQPPSAEALSVESSQKRASSQTVEQQGSKHQIEKQKKESVADEGATREEDQSDEEVASATDRSEKGGVDKAVATEKSIRGLVTSRFKKNRDRFLGRKP